MIETLVVGKSEPGVIDRAVLVLRAGGLVAFPTDTVYGLAAMAFDGEAIEKIFTVKGRSREKAIPILIGASSGLKKVVSEVTIDAQKLAARFWPGPLTLVLTRHTSLPANLSSQPTVGVRMPNHPVALSLLRATGPLAVTSANLSGHPNASLAEEVYAQLGGLIELILDGGRTPGGVPSTVVKCLGTAPVILREGPISQRDILSALEP